MDGVRSKVVVPIDSIGCRVRRRLQEATADEIAAGLNAGSGILGTGDQSFCDKERPRGSLAWPIRLVDDRASEIAAAKGGEVCWMVFKRGELLLQPTGLLQYVSINRCGERAGDDQGCTQHVAGISDS
eukprot:scaffold3572_cov125-Isochrysis_galbana.AAC.2